MNKQKDKIVTIELDGVNSYLIPAKSGFVLVDTGGHLTTDRKFSNRRKQLMEKLTAEGCTKGSLRLIFLTHGDNDHVANAAYLREQFGCPIAIHPDDLELVENPTLNLAMASFQYRSVELQKTFEMMKEIITEVTQKTLDDFERFKPDILLSDGFQMDDYGIDASVVHMPGHTAGSVGLLFSDGSFLSGDTFVNVEKPESAINATDFALLAKSVERLHGMNIQTVYPGHGSSFRFDEVM